MKRNTLSFMVLLAVALFVVGCGKQSSKEVAATWLNDFYHLDYDAAKKVSTDGTKKLLSQLQQFAGHVGDSTRRAMNKIVVTVKDVQEKGDTARATYVISDMPSREQPLMLIRKNGAWLVEFTKNSGLDEAEENTPAVPEDDSMNVASDSTMQQMDTAKH